MWIYYFVEIICLLQIFVHTTILDAAEHKREALVEVGCKTSRSRERSQLKQLK